MSSSIVSEPLRVAVKPSRLALYYLIAAHALALWGLLQAGLAGVSLLLLVSLFIYLWRWQRHGDVRALLLQGDGCVIERGDGDNLKFTLARRHVVTNFLVILQLRDSQRFNHRYVPLFCDALDAEAFRRLRVLLRFPVSAKPEAGSSVASE